MANDRTELVRRLADLLRRENEALGAMNFPGATALLAEKSAAIELLVAAAEPSSAAAGDDAAALARSLNELIVRNKSLLGRAIATQQRVIGIVVQAATAAAPRSCYGAGGCLTGAKGPMTLRTRA